MQPTFMLAVIGVAFGCFAALALCRYQGWLASIEAFRKKNPQAVELAVQRGAQAAAAATGAASSSSGAGGAAAAAGSVLNRAEAEVAAIGSAALAAASSLLHVGVAAPLSIDAAAPPAAAAHGLSPTSSAALDAVASAPSSPLPPEEWRWMRRGLTAVPGVGPHVDNIMAGVATARGALQGFSSLELLCAGLVILAALLASFSSSGVDTLVSLLLPWRWPGLLASISPSFLMLVALLVLVVLQRRSLEASHRQIHMLAQSHRVHTERHAASQRQIGEMAAQIQQILARPAVSPGATLGTTLRVDEHHFS